MNKIYYITLFLIQFSFISNSDKSILFSLPLEKEEKIFNLLIGDKIINCSYISKGSIDSNISFIINNCNNDNCYEKNESKYQNKSNVIQINGLNTIITGKVYKELIKINDISLNEQEFIFTKLNNLSNGFFIISHKLISLLKKNELITKKIISYSHSNISNKLYLDVNIGSKYNLKEYKNYDICKMIENSFGCYLQKIIIGNSINDLKDNKNLSINIFNITMLTEFYNSKYGTEDYIIGNRQKISYIKEILKNNQFTCKNENNITNCFSVQKIALFVFGIKGIALTSIKIKELEEDVDNIYFGLRTIDKLDIIIDAEKENIILHSNDDNILIEDISSFWKFWILILLLILILIGVIVFISLELKKNNLNDEEKLI